MVADNLRAGAAERVITPHVGTPLVGWLNRAAGDAISRAVHDDLYVRALAVETGGSAWVLIATDLVGVDPVMVGEIRAGVARETGVPAEAVLVSATHCHSGPAVCPIASAVHPDDMGAVRADGSLPERYGKPVTVQAHAIHVDIVDLAWRARLLEQAVAASSEAWAGLKPAEIAFGQVEVQGLASSRRVRLANGSWADPRRPNPTGAAEISRTRIDPMVRTLLMREQRTGAPLAVVVNYGTHPWVFSSPAISAELPGAVAPLVAAGWAQPGTRPPVVLYTTGPQGDVSLIRNVDVANVWQRRQDEDPVEDLRRRTTAFEHELARLGRLLAGKVLEITGGPLDWDGRATVEARRKEVLLPLKPGYERPAGLFMATWQLSAPKGFHLSEVQALRIGDVGILALPGEPFASLGHAIRAHAPSRPLLIAAVANDYGEAGYAGDRAAYEQGGYELVTGPLDAGAGEALVEASVELLQHVFGGTG